MCSLCPAHAATPCSPHSPSWIFAAASISAAGGSFVWQKEQLGLNVTLQQHHMRQHTKTCSIHAQPSHLADVHDAGEDQGGGFAAYLISLLVGISASCYMLSVLLICALSAVMHVMRTGKVGASTREQ